MGSIHNFILFEPELGKYKIIDPNRAIFQQFQWHKVGQVRGVSRNNDIL